MLNQRRRWGIAKHGPAQRSSSLVQLVVIRDKFVFCLLHPRPLLHAHRCCVISFRCFVFVTYLVCKKYGLRLFGWFWFFFFFVLVWVILKYNSYNPWPFLEIEKYLLERCMGNLTPLTSPVPGSLFPPASFAPRHVASRTVCCVPRCIDRRIVEASAPSDEFPSADSSQQEAGLDV